MKKAILDTRKSAPDAKKRGRGRPPTNRLGVQVRLLPEMVDALDDWIAAQPTALSRPEAIRLCVADKLRMPPARKIPAPELSDAAWRLLRKHAFKTDGEFTTFTGDWANWNWLLAEILKRSQGKSKP